MLGLLVALPILAGSVGALTRTKDVSMWMLSVSWLVLAWTLLLLATPFQSFHWTFLQLAGYSVHISLQTGSMPDWMAIVTALINVMAQLYSVGYFARDPRKGYFQAILLAFSGSMLLTVFGYNLLTQFVGWEFMGVGSYLLVGYFRTQTSARFAASKAMLVTRLGDILFLIAVAASVVLHTTSLVAVNHHGSALIAWGLVVAVAAKSAQGPNASWLLDAMAGPTPASALIHAATMVAAGPYLLIRYFPLLSHTPGVLPVLLVLGGFTALMAAIGALGATEAKRLLAFSTVSQLGMMVLAVGMGSPTAAWTLLVAHAFYKALLFFTTGIASNRANSGALKNLSGSLTRVEFALLFMAGALAVSGFPPTGGFVAKETLFHAAQSIRGGMILDLLLSAAGGAYAARLVRALAGNEKPRMDRASFWMISPAILLTTLVLFSFVWHPWVALSPITLLASIPSLLAASAGIAIGVSWTKPFSLFSGSLWSWLWQGATWPERLVLGFEKALTQGVSGTLSGARLMTRLVHLGGSGRAQRYVLISGIVVALLIMWNVRA